VVAEHNARNAGYTLALNAYADLTFEEFAQTKLGYNPKLARSSNRAAAASVDEGNEAPSQVDWREKGVVTPVKNQGAVSRHGCHLLASICWPLCGPSELWPAGAPPALMPLP
jgi:hypothetical protein